MFYINKNITKFDKIIFYRCLINPIFQYWRCLFFINMNIFRQLKLEIALAIPASSEIKILTNNSAGRGLKLKRWRRTKPLECVRYDPLESGTWHFWVVEGLQSGMISYYSGYGYCIRGSDSPNFPTRPANYWPRRFIHVSISPEKRAKWINNSVSVVGHRLWSWATIENINTLPNKHSTPALCWINDGPPPSTLVQHWSNRVQSLVFAVWIYVETMLVYHLQLWPKIGPNWWRIVFVV